MLGFYPLGTYPISVVGDKRQSINYVLDEDSMNILQVASITADVLSSLLIDKYIQQEERQEAIVQTEPKEVVEMSFQAGMDVEMTFVLEV